MIDRGRVGMAVDDLPLAVLAPVEVCDTQCVVLDRAGVERDVLVSHGVGQLAAAASRDQVVVEGPARDDTRHRRPEIPPDLVVYAADAVNMTGPLRGVIYPNNTSGQAK